MKTLDVSIIIISWNTREILQDCLRTVYDQTKRIDFEVIVVDNASSDGTVEMVRREFPRVVLIANDSNRGFAAGNNQGMAVAAGRYVLLLNSDTLLREGAIEKTVAFADAHSDAAVIGCRVLGSDRTLQSSCFMFPSVLNMLLLATYLYRLFPGNRFLGRERMTYWNRSDARDVDVVAGCFMLIRGEAIDRVGVMDESFFMYAEETDWCYRFKQARWRVMFTPSASIIHLGGASSRQVASQMRLQLSGSILYFLKKHRSRPEYVLACLLTALFFLTRIPFWLIKAGLFPRTRANSWRVVQTYAAGVIAAFRGYRGLCMAKSPASCNASNSGMIISQVRK